MIKYPNFDDVLISSIRHYLDQSGKLLEIVTQRPDAADLLAVQLAPDTFDTGFHLAVAIQFAARAVCIPGGATVPEIIEPYSITSLHSLHREVLEALDNAHSIHWTSKVSHVAGNVHMTQTAADYVLRFAFPNMLFHLSQAYAGLRLSGLAIGKADFDGLHEY